MWIINKKSNGDKINIRWEIAKIAVSLVLCAASLVGGSLLKDVLPEAVKDIVAIMFIVLFFAMFAIIIGAYMAVDNIKKKQKNRTVREDREAFLEQKERIRKAWRSELAKVTFPRVLASALKVIFVLEGIYFGMIGTLSPHKYVVFAFCCFASFIMIFEGIGRIATPITSAYLKDSEYYVTEEEFPALYAVVKRAAKTMDVDGRFFVALEGTSNAGIGDYRRNDYSIILGALLLGVLTEEELYTVLLHEFAHVKSGIHKRLRREERLAHWLMNGIPNTIWQRSILKMAYSPLESIFMYRYTLFNVAFSPVREEDADKMAFAKCDRDVAASALIKISYDEMLAWEVGNEDSPEEDLAYFTEESPGDLISSRLAKLKKAAETKAEKWIYFRNREILSRSASHPTLKMRLQALGIEHFNVKESASSPLYEQEVEKAVKKADAWAEKNFRASYLKLRAENYLKPLETVKEWEEEGRPLDPVKYGDVEAALRNLGRVTEAEELLDRAIAELPSYAAAKAYFMKGALLMHRFDAAGIDLVYRAIDENNNYVQEGIQMIGEFCCLTGNEEELERYRERVVELMQNKFDVSDKLFTLNKGDNFTRETLPEGVLERDIESITAAGEGKLDAIYLVRKSLSEEVFTSIYVLKFIPGTDDKTQERVYHSVFMYLDTVSDWQYSLYVYDEEGVKNIGLEKIEGSLVWLREVAPAEVPGDGEEE
jgi:tetratricopeptide (TPR) repeat protein